MEQIRRRRMDAGGWSAVLERFAESGLSVAEFCAHEGIGAASFYRWRSLLNTAARDRKRRRLRREASRPASAESFVDLGTLRANAAESSRMEVRLDLGGGLVLHVVRR
jgi:putative transposase